MTKTCNTKPSSLKRLVLVMWITTKIWNNALWRWHTQNEPATKGEHRRHTELLRYLRLFHYVYIDTGNAVARWLDGCRQISTQTQKRNAHAKAMRIIEVAIECWIHCDHKNPSIVVFNYFKLNVFRFVCHLFESVLFSCTQSRPQAIKRTRGRRFKVCSSAYYQRFNNGKHIR